MLSEPPRKVTVSILTSRVAEMEANYRNGVLPRPGGWFDQDQVDVEAIRIAASARSHREGINQQKRKRKNRSQGRGRN